jgi:HD-like signal output (HDOD) protein
LNNQEQPALNKWTERIRDHEMPIFGRTVQSVLSVAEDDDAPAAQLAQVVLQDASMTARVLKLANSTFYNPREQGISTITRAVIVLGFNTVRTMCLSIALVDSFVRGSNRDQLTSELARAIHAAVQARAIAVERGDHLPEEVFIATLLYHIGDMAFWCFSGEEGEELQRVMQQPGYTPEQAQEEVLGFRLKELSNNLAQEWRLNPLLREALKGADSTRTRNITLARNLAAVAEEQGWKSEETAEVVKKLAKISGQSDKQVTELLHHNAREAAQIAGYYGAANAAKAIPLPGNGAESAPEEEAAEEVAQFPEPDSMLQLRILRELSMTLESSTDFNMIMELVLEGVYRGIGMDRVLFALLTPDRKGLRAKFGLGHKQEELAAQFHFTKRPESPNLFFEVLESGHRVWFDPANHPELRPLVGSSINGVIGKVPFFISPLEVRGNRIGLIYADRGPSKRPLDDEAFDSFQHFAKQANMGLTLIAGQR